MSHKVRAVFFSSVVVAVALVLSRSSAVNGASDAKRLLRKKPVDRCAVIDCMPAYECDPQTGQCVAITCDAPTACPEGSTCIPEEIFCITNPCPQFTCQPDPGNLCAGVSCIFGEECDPLNGQCVPVLCDSPNACPNEICVPEEIFCITNPCPQFTCQSDPGDLCAGVSCIFGDECDSFTGECVPVLCDSPNACPNEVCVPEEFFCITNPCPQFVCEPKVSSCAAIQCLQGHECDPLTGTCVAVTCEAVDACPCGQLCVPEEIFCIRDPCPQFTCENDGPECVVCPLVVPMCDADCETCKVVPQTCNECSFAICLDDDCVICPQVVPECDPTCKGECMIHPQACHTCSYAECILNK